MSLNFSWNFYWFLDFVSNSFLEIAGAEPNHVDVKGNTSAHLCVLEHRLNCLKQIIENASVNLEIKNYDGLTPLHLAVRHQQLDLIKCLAESGASPYTTDARTGDTILHTAVEQRSLEIVEYITEIFTKQDLVNTANQADHFPVHILIGNYEEVDEDQNIPAIDLTIANYLIRKGADVSGISKTLLTRIESIQIDAIAEVNQAVRSNRVQESSIPVVEAAERPIVAEPIKFDEQAFAELINILRVEDKWRDIAVVLEFGRLLPVWESTDTPSKCLLEYIQVSVGL